MAGADKMYFTKEEYIQIKKLWLKTRKKQKKELGHEIWMYPFANLEKIAIDHGGKITFGQYEYQYDPAESDLDIECFSDNDESPVFNVSTKTELWLLKNFKLDCIKREVTNQLTSFFYQDIPEKLRFNFVEELDFSIPDAIISIYNKNKKITLNFTEINGDEMTFYDKMLLYGSNNVIEIIGQAKEQINNYKNLGLKVDFTFCGLFLEYRNGKIYHKNKEIFIPFLSPEFKDVKIKHSYNLKDAKKYNPNQIIICTDKVCANSTIWKTEFLKRIFLFEFSDEMRKRIIY